LGQSQLGIKSNQLKLNTMSEQNTQTFGQKAVGASFNPSNDSAVDNAKSLFASIIDQANDLRNSSNSPEQKRLASVAITEAQTAQMWLVKALTWKD
jgi:hypothetical protein